MEADLEAFREHKKDVKQFKPYLVIVPKYYGKTEQEIIDALEKIEHFNTRNRDFKYITSFMRWKHTEVPLLDAYRKTIEEAQTQIQDLKTSEPLKVDKESLVKKISELPESNYQEITKKLVLKMMADENFVLRSDLISIKYRNFNETDNKIVMNTMHFKNLRKKGECNISFIIKENTLDLITKLLGFPESSESDYIFNIKTSDGNVPKQPNDNFAKYIKRISKQVCGYDLGLNDYRKLFASTKTAETEKKLKNGEITIKEAISELQDASSSSNHSLETHLKYYVYPVKESEETVEEPKEPKGKEPEIVEEVKPDTITIIINGNEITVPRGVPFTVNDNKYCF